MKNSLANFLDANGRVKQWPSKRMPQIEVIGYIASKFPFGSIYSEQEINQILKELHTFGDWAILRRELCDLRYFTRDKNGTAYTRSDRV